MTTTACIINDGSFVHTHATRGIFSYSHSVIVREARAERVVLVDGEGHVLDHLFQRRVRGLVNRDGALDHEVLARDELVLARAVGLHELAVLRGHERVVSGHLLGVHLADELANLNLLAVFVAEDDDEHPVGQLLVTLFAVRDELHVHPLAVLRQAVLAVRDLHVPVHLQQEIVPGDLSGDFRLAQLLELAALGEARDFALRPHDQGAAAHGTRAGTLTRRDGRDGRAADDDGGSEGGGGH
mmetsp:Transcript_11038/g.46392  ORF Transcript_11038/g.46392 Transcript_11038/m.46392 type:complete len:241 (+) Transcript_11038:680-1402(+)